VAKLVACFCASALALIAGQQPTPVKPSQHGTVTQHVAGTTIAIEYDRPVARGRDLFGALVPYDRVWCPGANECTTLTVSTDVKINGQPLAAGTYTLWARPGASKWTMIVNRAHPVFHTQHERVADQDLLKIEVTPESGPHMETLAFYFPVVDAHHAKLVLHWGTVMVPLSIDVP
jgi:uncharacterized Zn-binding protein involved in type VI secretion